MNRESAKTATAPPQTILQDFSNVSTNAKRLNILKVKGKSRITHNYNTCGALTKNTTSEYHTVNHFESTLGIRETTQPS